MQRPQFAPRPQVCITLAAALIAGCSESPPDRDLASTSLYAAVAGLDGVYFHPPLGPDPSPSGTFDATLLDGLSIVLESVSSGGSVTALATFTRSTTPAVVLLRAHELYWINIPAAAYVTDRALTYRVRAELDGTELGTSVLSERIFDVLAHVPTLPIGVRLRIEGSDAVRAVPRHAQPGTPPTKPRTPPPTCTNGVQDKDETGVDCGGSVCPACPTCTDAVKNGSETGVDCGGSVCPSCPIGQPCLTNADCASDRCTSAVCVCAPEADATFCARLGLDCGDVTAADNCGTSRSVSCGTCQPPAVCGGRGAPNRCECPPETNEAFCLRLHKNCDVFEAADSCGATRSASCGMCAAPETCGGLGVPNVCGCAPESNAAFCARLRVACGPAAGADTCGLARSVDCGTCASCVLDAAHGGGTLAHNATRIGYAAASVACGGSCAAVATAMTCNNGVMSYGGATTDSCSVAACASCTNPGGGTTAHGGSLTLYQSSNACGGTCTSETRTCDNGSWSAPFTYSATSCSTTCSSCTVDPAHGGGTLAHGATRVGYTASSVACGGSCSTVETTMTCNNGVMSYAGATTNSCSVAACASCTNPGGGTTAHGGSLTLYQSSNACGGTCASQTRTCSNGSWSSPFTYSATSCSTTCSSCTVDAAHGGGTLAHNATRTGYTVTSVPCGHVCSESTYQRTMRCNNGVMDYAGATTNTCGTGTCSFTFLSYENCASANMMVGCGGGTVGNFCSFLSTNTSGRFYDPTVTIPGGPTNGRYAAQILGYTGDATIDAELRTVNAYGMQGYGGAAGGPAYLCNQQPHLQSPAIGTAPAHMRCYSLGYLIGVPYVPTISCSYTP